MGKRLEEIEMLYGKGKQCLKNEHIDYLLSEVHRLRGEIKKYLDNEYGLGWDKRNDLYPQDKKLREVVEEK